jgi:hypothetical protein
MIKQFADRHDLAHMVVVADAGMLSVTNLRELDRARLLAVSASWSSCAGGRASTSPLLHRWIEGGRPNALAARLRPAGRRPEPASKRTSEGDPLSGLQG